MLILTSCNGIDDQQSDVAAITALDEDMHIELMLGQSEKENYLVVQSDDKFLIADLICVCEDSGVAEISCNMTDVDNVIRFTVKAVGTGETKVYFGARGTDITSESISITVTEQEIATTATTTVEQTTVKTDTESAAAAVNTYATNNNDTTVAAVADNSQIVYITPSGKKYHLSKTCAGVNAIETTLQEASKSREPCKKCAQ